jgi:hypothetical protein
VVLGEGGAADRDLVGLTRERVEEVDLELALAREHLEVVDAVDRGRVADRLLAQSLGAQVGGGHSALRNCSTRDSWVSRIV